MSSATRAQQSCIIHLVIEKWASKRRLKGFKKMRNEIACWSKQENGSEFR